MTTSLLHITIELADVSPLCTAALPRGKCRDARLLPPEQAPNPETSDCRSSCSVRAAACLSKQVSPIYQERKCQQRQRCSRCSPIPIQASRCSQNVPWPLLRGKSCCQFEKSSLLWSAQMQRILRRVYRNPKYALTIAIETAEIKGSMPIPRGHHLYTRGCMLYVAVLVNGRRLQTNILRISISHRAT